MTVSLVEILAAARAHVAPLAAESAGYLLLGVADHLSLSPRSVLAEDVELLADGAVRLRARANSNAAPADIEHSVRALLRRTLEVASAAGPALRRAAERSDGPGLPTLVRELENALIPVNRAAAKRALSRVHRETERALASGKLESLLTAAASEPALPVVVAADFPEASPVSLPAVVAAPPAPPIAVAAPIDAGPAAPVAPRYEPTPLPADRELELTKPEPVVQRSRERAQRTPQLGTLMSALGPTMAEPERTERAPLVDELLELSDDELVAAETLVAPEVPVELASAPEAARADPEPSVLPDVLLAMVELHSGVSPDEAPTRLRDVVTHISSPEAPAWPDAPAMPDALLSPPPSEVEESWLTHSSIPGAEAALPSVLHSDEASVEPPSATFRFESERLDPALHDALTWDPGPVIGMAAPLPSTLLVAPPAELSPLVPAVLPVQSSQVSELVDSFHVSGAAEENELRAALAELAAASLTPAPRRYGESS